MNKIHSHEYVYKIKNTLKEISKTIRLPNGL